MSKETAANGEYEVSKMADGCREETGRGVRDIVVQRRDALPHEFEQESANSGLCKRRWPEPYVKCQVSLPSGTARRGLRSTPDSEQTRFCFGPWWMLALFFYPCGWLLRKQMCRLGP